MRKLSLSVAAIVVIGIIYLENRAIGEVPTPSLIPITTYNSSGTEIGTTSNPINVTSASTSTVTSHAPTYQKTWSTLGGAWNTFTVSSGQGTWQIVVTGNPDTTYCEMQGSIDGGATQYTLDSWTTNSGTTRHITNKTSDMVRGWCSMTAWTTAGSWTIRDRFIGGR